MLYCYSIDVCSVQQFWKYWKYSILNQINWLVFVLLNSIYLFVLFSLPHVLNTTVYTHTHRCTRHHITSHFLAFGIRLVPWSFHYILRNINSCVICMTLQSHLLFIFVLIENSAYGIFILQEDFCNVLCQFDLNPRNKPTHRNK